MEKHSDVYFPGFIEEIDKGAVIKGAEAFIYPSLFEGFGLPLLEAMKCGTPVMTSNRSSMPEVIGNAGILVDPENPLHIAEAMREILKPDVRNRLLTNMACQIQKFSWEKCAKETLHVLTSGRTGK
jgi:glycosyltransferase involved in cell wall biosynthesis